MKTFLSTYLSLNYLWVANSGTKFEKYYLYLSAFLIIAAFLYRVVLFIRGNRPIIYRGFDLYLFWGYFSLGLLGLWIYFTRTQALPIFSTRLISYAWFLLIAVFSAYLIYYYKKKLPGKLTEFAEKSRKEKYLGRK